MKLVVTTIKVRMEQTRICDVCAREAFKRSVAGLGRVRALLSCGSGLQSPPIRGGAVHGWGVGTPGCLTAGSHLT